MAPAESLPITLTLTDESATARLAAGFARMAAMGDVFALSGQLGAGKTAFARGFIRALPGGDSVGEIPSPSFTLSQLYELSTATVWHFDLYRLADPEEVWELGWEEAMATGIMLVEWPERAGPHLPPARFDIALAMLSRQDARLARLAAAGGDRPQRLAALAAAFEHAA